MSLLLEKKTSSSNSSLLEKRDIDDRQPTRSFSSKQEKAVAKAINGSVNLNSGATPFIKGDCMNKSWLIECKTKTSHSSSISIKKDWLEKNKQEALFMGKPYNALAFSFGPDEENYYIIDEYLFQTLIQVLENQDP